MARIVGFSNGHFQFSRANGKHSQISASERRHRHRSRPGVVRNLGTLYVSGKLPTYPSLKLTLTLSSHLGQNVGLGEW